MELWIRSQDKWTLTTAKSVYVRFPDENRASIFNQDNINIGQYSWDRALEVLDEIQKLLQPQTIINYDSKLEFHPEYAIQTIVKTIPKMETKELSTYVYEMPKE